MRGTWGKFLLSWLTHRVDIILPGGTTNFGEPANGTRMSQVPCFIDGSTTRTATEGSQDRTVDFEVLFDREIPVDLQAQFVNGRDRAGNVVLESARAVRIDTTDHPDLGVLVQSVLAVRN